MSRREEKEQALKEQLSDEGSARQNERARRILDAALELLQRWGYRKTTLDDIAKEAGVTRGMLYQHWKTREALFEALLQREYLAFMRDFRAHIASDPRSALLSSLMRHLVALTYVHPLLKAVFQGDSEMLGDLIRSPTGQQLIPTRLAVSRAYLEQLRSKGLLRTDVGVDMQLKMLAAVCTGFFLIDQIMPSDDLRFSPDEMVHGLSETIQRTFEPEEEPSSVVVEEATHAFLLLFDQFISALEQRNQDRNV